MTISIIAALDRNGLIGRGNNLPWRIPADLKYFKEVTDGRVIVMGSTTYESIGKPLSNRVNVVLTNDAVKGEHYRKDGCIVVHTVNDVLEDWLKHEEEVFIIGGREVYRQFLPYAQALYLTHIDHEFEGDTFFPEYNKKNFELVSLTYKFKGESTPYDLKFAIYERANH